MAPPTMKALVTGKRPWLTILYNGITKRDFGHGVSIKEDHPTPQMLPNEMLVKIKSVALNPTDWKHMDFISPPNIIIGCDYAGEVLEIGADVPKDAWKVGERVAGVTHGGLFNDQGAFCEYARIPYDLAWKPPASISDQEATTYGVSAITSMQAYYHNLGLPWPDTTDAAPEGDSLVYGASTCAGLFALQMVHFAGVRAVATCSPRNFDLVKKYGADVAIDYKSPTLASDLAKAGPNTTTALDCVGSGKACVKAIRETSGKGEVVHLQLQSKTTKSGVTIQGILAYTLKGMEFQFFAPLGPKFPAVPEDRAALARFYKILPGLIEWMRPPPIEVLEGGWDALLPGLDRLRKGKVSGTKLVVKLVD